jgi:4a-hydroxytetrahydrobiopterin dehydratase
MSDDLATMHCAPQHGVAMTAAEIAQRLADVDGWLAVDGAIEKAFRFADYHETMAFVNALAWIAHREDHHPELLLGYNRCVVRWSTHSVGGVSINDFVCAARADALLGRAA